MSIIEKFRIKPISRHNMWSGTSQKLMCDSESVEKLEQQNREMLEALIDIATGEKMHVGIRSIIEKADPQHRPWSEIQKRT